MRHAEARISSPLVHPGRVVVLDRIGTEHPVLSRLGIIDHQKKVERSTIGTCCQCGIEIRFIDSTTAIETIDELACSGSCAQEAGFYPPPQKFVPEHRGQKEREPCPDCGGRAYRNGFKHKETCPRAVVVAKGPRPPCPECGGPASRGRGYAHVEGCSNTGAARAKAKLQEKKLASPRQEKPPCSECGGPAGRIRGYVHTNECSLSSVNKLKAARQAAQEQRPRCPSCGGIAYRRGFRHTDECKRGAKQQESVAGMKTKSKKSKYRIPPGAI